jgi:magnesium-transporting ATPase (P-type)
LKIGKINIQITPRRKDALIVIIWAVVIALIMVKAHILMYQNDPLYYTHGKAWVEYKAPSLQTIDMFILAAMSIIVTIILSDVKPIIYGFAASHALSFVIAVGYVSLFIWYTLGYGELFSGVSYGWEDAIYLGFLNMFFVMVPWVIGISAIGLVVGVIVRNWIKST